MCLAAVKAARRPTSTTTPGCKRQCPCGRGKSTNFIGMEAAMKRNRVATSAIPLLIGIGLLLSACAEGDGYRGGPAYGYGYPAYGSFYGGGWEGWHRGW